MSRTIIPFGPQHPVLPEPIHLQLVMDNETVVEALPKLGYVHRGLETLTTLRDYNQMIYIVERVCGICSCIHALCFCRAIEHLMDVEVPRRPPTCASSGRNSTGCTAICCGSAFFADALGFEKPVHAVLENPRTHHGHQRSHGGQPRHHLHQHRRRRAQGSPP